MEALPPKAPSGILFYLTVISLSVRLHKHSSVEQVGRTWSNTLFGNWGAVKSVDGVGYPVREYPPSS